MLTLIEINIFPIKSLGGIKVKSARLTGRGLEHDRRWMLVDAGGQFLSQRTLPVLSRLAVSIQGESMQVQSRDHDGGEEHSIEIPIHPPSSEVCKVNIWDDECDAIAYPQEVNRWFADRIGQECKLVFMPDDSQRPVDPDYAVASEQVSFADGFPTMLIGESSLNDLNSRLKTVVSMDRFRTNLVFSGGPPFAEDSWRRIRVGTVEFIVAKPCARCVITTVDPVTSEHGVEPLRTLATYRKQQGGVMFGQNLLHSDSGEMAVGDPIEIIE